MKNSNCSWVPRELSQTLRGLSLRTKQHLKFDPLFVHILFHFIIIYYMMGIFMGAVWEEASKPWPQGVHSLVGENACKLVTVVQREQPWEQHSGTLFSVAQSFATLCNCADSKQHVRLPCPSPSPGACSNSCPLSRRCHPTISSAAEPRQLRCHEKLQWHC